ncbi:uncharacterized protein MONBRDRAFT_29387 [Monosiga brevicollis MX1]|uniref:Uncharacterized protein n=1 Tax=Monosiga brevicollis TaxID=81824 RepID=A9VAY1_MONBE|nr:uncharacterized protein MONBRDRAFT_29387 [Monosiga brevicollis MX1]EDQ85243.1 predicted protein [Monosiga brevicollis MX1]|eukprot:XP_001749864.1 hypothetical protein [Monosiga brevicollis MX1]
MAGRKEAAATDAEVEYRDPWGDVDLLDKNFAAFEKRKQELAAKKQAEAAEQAAQAKAEEAKTTARDSHGERRSDSREKQDDRRSHHRHDDRRRHDDDRRRRDYDDRRRGHDDRRRGYDDRRRDYDERRRDRDDRRGRYHERDDRRRDYDDRRRDERRDHHSRRDREHARAKEPAPAPVEEAQPPMSINAVMVADRVNEILGAKTIRRSDLEPLFTPGFQLLALSDEQELGTRSELDDLLRILDGQAGWKVHVRRRLYIESTSNPDLSFALDIYAPGSGSLFDAHGPTDTAPTGATALLWRIQFNHCAQVYASAVEGTAVSETEVAQSDFMDTSVVKQALDLVLRPGGLTSDIALHYNDYINVPVLG